MNLEDPRKTGLKNGLRQLTINQLKRVISYSGEMVLDDCNYQDGKFCPLAIGLELDKTIDDPTDQKVVEFLTNSGYKIYNTRGILGEFYTNNRKEDLLTAAHEVLAEKMSECPCLTKGASCGVCQGGYHTFCNRAPHGDPEEAYDWFVSHPEDTLKITPLTPSPEYRRAMKEIIRRNAAK